MQEDIPERNQQVKLMNHIFGTAKPVLAWLGDDIGDVCPTLPEDIWQAERFRGRSSGYNAMNGNVNVAAGDKRKKFTRLHKFEPVSTTEVETFLRLCRAITALCERDYWHRVWIVPEVFVAQQLVLCCGGQRIPWKDLSNICGGLLSSFPLQSLP
jgi:Heterokaryon incompatibility protein (HET)